MRDLTLHPDLPDQEEMEERKRNYYRSLIPRPKGLEETVVYPVKEHNPGISIGLKLSRILKMIFLCSIFSK